LVDLDDLKRGKSEIDFGWLAGASPASTVVELFCLHVAVDFCMNYRQTMEEVAD